MADVFSRKKRSDIMSRVKGRGNVATELRLIRIFRKYSITGWRRHLSVFGNPDFVFPKLHLAIFVDGCFWHGCPLHGSLPETNRKFWERKLERNKTRDRLVNRALKAKGWIILRLWQHELLQQDRVAKHVKAVLIKIKGIHSA
jgi:DNA mismatch endonuclease (patch repair protein)